MSNFGLPPLGPLPPPSPPLYTSEQPGPHERREFLIGLGIGAVPLVLVLIAIGLLFAGANPYGSPLNGILTISGVGSLVLLLLDIVAMIILLLIKSARTVGLGILTALVASVVIVCIGCTVVPSLLF